MNGAHRVFQTIDKVLILACGTSYYSGCTALGFRPSLAVAHQVEVASEYRYRDSVPDARTLVVCISQSGETADTLAAPRHARSLGMEHTLTICNVATSAMVRECKMAYITVRWGGDRRGLHQSLHHATGGCFAHSGAGGRMRAAQDDAERSTSRRCATLPVALQVGAGAGACKSSPGRKHFAAKKHALFWAGACTTPLRWRAPQAQRDQLHPRRSLPRGRAQARPLALVTGDMPVVTVAPNDALLEKLKNNMHEVRARGGVLYMLADADTRIESGEGLPRDPHARALRRALAPAARGAAATAGLPLARWRAAPMMDKPRNLAKSVTVE